MKLLPGIKTVIALAAVILATALLMGVTMRGTGLPEYAGPSLENPFTINDNPYLNDNGMDDGHSGDAVCGIKIDAARGKYFLKTFIDRDSAEKNGFKITHYGQCGTCSTLQDLNVYKTNPDLTRAVRKCSITLMHKSWAMNCLKKLGFSEHCAETWYYNMVNTGRKCFPVCALSWLKGEDYNNPDGSLNACLACDEKESGPVFKRCAGRTRRNSGIASEIKRSGGEVHHLVHDYIQ